MAKKADVVYEINVTQIEFTTGATHSNRAFSPKGGNVKWFRDELGQLWVKFQSQEESGRYHGEPRYDGAVIDRVWPARRVVEVQYDRSTR